MLLLKLPDGGAGVGRDLCTGDHLVRLLPPALTAVCPESCPQIPLFNLQIPIPVFLLEHANTPALTFYLGLPSELIDRHEKLQPFSPRASKI